MSITILHHKYRRLLWGILYIVMGTIRYQIYNRIACDDSVSDWYKINLGSSVGTVAVICQRGIAKRLSIDNKDNSPRPTIYYWRIYIEHERFVAYYSYTPLKLAISFDKNNMVNASNYLNMFSLKDTSTLFKLSAKIINNL